MSTWDDEDDQIEALAFLLEDEPPLCPGCGQKWDDKRGCLSACPITHRECSHWTGVCVVAS